MKFDTKRKHKRAWILRDGQRIADEASYASSADTAVILLNVLLPQHRWTIEWEYREAPPKEPKTTEEDMTLTEDERTALAKYRGAIEHDDGAKAILERARSIPRPPV